MIHRLLIDGRARFASPFALGSGEASLASDRPLLVDDRGRPRVTATALAGSLRSLLERIAASVTLDGVEGDDALMALFGSALDDEATGDGPGGKALRSRPSRLRVGEPVAVGAGQVVLRDGVGIDRSSGGAKEDIKFDYEVAEGDAQFRVHLEFERGASGDQLAAAAEALLVLGLREWQEGRLTLGGRAGSGLGVFVLDEVEVRLLDLSDRDTLRNWLRARTGAAPAGRQAGVVLPGGLNALGAVGARGVVAYQAGPDGSSPGWLTAVVDLQADGPLLVAGASPVPQIVDHGPTHVADTSGSDAQALGRRGGGGDTSPILPGSSLRGVLRSRAEQVVRFLGGPAAACDPFEDDARSPRLSCGRRALPGAAAGLAVENASPARRRQLEGGRALALRNGSCPVCRLFGTSQLGGRVTVAESLLEGGSVQLLDHVAIDRFTGGAVDARKFDAAPVVGARARLTIRVDRPTPSDAVLMLFVLRDLAEGWVPVGSRVTRGYGAVRGRLSEFEIADVGAGPWAGVTAGADVEPGAIWRARRFTPPGTTFLGRDHAWDWLDDESELRRALVGGAKELSAQSSAWQLGIENRSPSNDN